MYRPVPLCDISQVVRTGTYYIIVQVGTGRYVPVRTDMYQVYRIPDDVRCPSRLRYEHTMSYVMYIRHRMSISDIRHCQQYVEMNTYDVVCVMYDVVC